MVVGKTWGQAGTAATEPSTQPVNPDRVVLRVGDETMTAAQFDEFVSDLPPQVQEAARGPAKRMVAEQVVKIKLLAKAATDRGLENSPAFKRQLVMLRQQLLAQMLAEQIQNGDDAKLRAYYEAHKADFETATARHILIRAAGSPAPAIPGRKELTDAQAKAKAEEIRKRIVGGEDFATVAKEESDDAASAEHGGDLGTFSRGQMVPAFDAAVFALKPGEISQPVKTEFGYHIIQLLDKKEPTFEEVRPELASKMGGEKMDDLVEELKKKNPPMIDDAFFGPPTAAMAQ
jgi:peptidyl-prolyl cis-trans isomerase C